MIAGDEYQKYPLCLDNEEFGKYSIGVQMYFNFLKSTSIIFAFMALISILALVSNVYGGGVKMLLFFGGGGGGLLGWGADAPFGEVKLSGCLGDFIRPFRD